MIHLQQQDPRQEDIAAVAEQFRQEFADADDLADLSPPALRLLATAAALFHASRRGGDLRPRHHRGVRADARRAVQALRVQGRAAVPPGLPRPRAARRAHRRAPRRRGHAGRRVAAFVRGYVSGHLASPMLAQVVRREYVHLADDRLAEIVARRRAMRERLAALLRSGQRAGALRLIPGRTRRPAPR